MVTSKKEQQNEEIGGRLRLFGEKDFKNLVEFAKELGLSKQTLHKYTSGKHLMGTKLLARLALLNCNINWLITGIGEQHASLIIKEMQDRQKELDSENKSKFEKLEEENQNLRVQLARKLVLYGTVAEPKK